MSSHELIDAQFDRAVEIVQGLPKTGPIQTDYEEKLTMYSLYKQATEGNIKPPRPGMWDMLGRAKWDAWAKHKDLDPYEAKWLYVDALARVLRKYSRDANALELLNELESFGGDPANLVASRTFSRSPGSESSGSTVSEGDASHPFVRGEPSRAPFNHEEGDDGEGNSSEDENALGASLLRAPEMTSSQLTRPQSSLSSQHRYRTPMAGSLAMSPPPPSRSQTVPATQPMPGFETPSAFAEGSPLSPPGSFPTTNSFVANFSQSSRAELTSPNLYNNFAHRNVPLQTHPYRHYTPGRPASPPSIERAVENVQAHLAALTERIENLEATASRSRASGPFNSPRRTSPSAWGSGRGLTMNNGGSEWDADDLGMWSIVMHPLSKALDMLQGLASFFARDESRSPSQVIVRRLVLDASFIVFVVGLVKFLWRRSGVRRREVKAALIVLWRAILGVQPDRILMDRGV